MRCARQGTHRIAAHESPSSSRRSVSTRRAASSTRCPSTTFYRDTLTPISPPPTSAHSRSLPSSGRLIVPAPSQSIGCTATHKLAGLDELIVFQSSPAPKDGCYLRSRCQHRRSTLSPPLAYPKRGYTMVSPASPGPIHRLHEDQIAFYLSEYRRVLSMLAGYTTQAAHDLRKLVRGAIEELEQERQRRKGKPERA